jgi:hypothetical protein
MIDFYYWTTPNGHKITIFLEEAGLPYSIRPVNISKGEQFAPEFSRFRRTTGFRRLSILTPLTAKVHLAFLNLAPFCSIWLRRSGSFCRRIYVAGLKPCNGCSGKWRASDRWPGRTVTLTTMRRKRFLTQSTATSKKPKDSTVCSMSASPTASSSLALTPSPTWPLIRGLSLMSGRAKI